MVILHGIGFEQKCCRAMYPRKRTRERHFGQTPPRDSCWKVVYLINTKKSRPQPQTHSLSFSLILSHSLFSFSLILSHSLSFSLILSHSLSFSLILSHSLKISPKTQHIITKRPSNYDVSCNLKSNLKKEIKISKKQKSVGKIMNQVTINK